MARLNTHPSATPRSSRAPTVDSLYRDLTPAGPSRTARQSTRQSTYSVMSPALSQSSEKENDIPESHKNTPRPPSKRKVMAGARAQRLPTPDSGSTSNPNKRRRTHGNYDGESALQGTADGAVQIYEDEDEDGEGDDYAEDDGFEQGLPTPTDAEIEENGDDHVEDGLPTPSEDPDDDDSRPENRNYNPHQNPEKRRQIRSSYRNLQREVDDNRDEYIKPGSNRLIEVIPRATRQFGKVRMTADAVLDSHLLTSVTDLSSKQLKASLDQGNHGIGVDLDQFVSRCIFFMKEGRPPGADEDTQPASRGPRETQRGDDDDDDDEGGDGLDWAYLGRHACFPSNTRPPLSMFLLGPLSVQKRVRTTVRRARAQREPPGPATRPQEVDLNEIQKNESSSVLYQTTQVKARLREHIEQATAKFEAEEPETQEEFYDAMKRYRICQTRDEDPAVSLFDFAIHPRSFSQTVENLFYISFLIREGAVSVETDEDGLPLLAPQDPRFADEQREKTVDKRQAIFSIDYATWKALIEAFNIKEPLIPHREPEEQNVGANDWYN